MKKLLASVMAVAMLASMSTGAFADNLDNVPYFSDEDVIVLESAPESRINVSTTRNFRGRTWTTVARENLENYEDIMIKIRNLSGVDQLRVRVKKSGVIYIDRWMGAGDQYTFDADWEDGNYSIEFYPTADATVTYSIKTVS